MTKRRLENKAEADDIVACFGYAFSKKPPILPTDSKPPERLQELRDRIKEILTYVTLTTKIAHRVILIFWAITEAAVYHTGFPFWARCGLSWKPLAICQPV